MQTQEKKTGDDRQRAENGDGQLVTTHANDPPARARIWNNLANIKFKALYTHECSKRASRYSRLLLFLLALTSGSTVAAWAIWQEYKTTWAVIIGVGQVLSIAVPHIPFLKNDKEFLTMSFEFETLYLKYEKLWYDFQDGTADEAAVKAQISSLREKELSIEKTGVSCPRVTRWMTRIADETRSVLKLDLM